ncbi:MAG: sulfatase-like hydrolase/transferase [Oligoflexia bacterium]|nr:sulfatase-like hydrolase/transferase [Oligoflexia bacterium]
MSKKIQFFILYLFLLLFLNYIEFKDFSFFNELNHLYSATTFAKASLYLITYLLIILSFVVVLLNKSKAVRWVFIITNALALTLHFVFLEINGYGLKFLEIRLLVEEYKYANDAIRSFGFIILTSVLKAILFSILLLLPLSIRFRINKRWLVVAPIAFSLTYLILFKTSGTRDAFPALYRVPALAGLTFFGTSDQMYYGPKDKVTLTSNKNGIKKVILIVDEAVRGDFITINNSKIQTTPFLYSIKNEIKNLGVAISAANCSVDTNTILRTGVQLSGLPSKNGAALKLPTHFQYAKSAGYKTYYLDGQIKKGELQNHMSKYDLNAIDEIYNPKGKIHEHYIDSDLAKKIAEIIQKEEKSFVLVNKVGAHFSYNQRYPEEKAVFKPVMKNENFAKADINEMINTYANTIYWNVDGFFKELYPSIKELDSLAVIYTSDHGASFGGTGDHCATINVPQEQLIVPLFIMGREGKQLFKTNNLKTQASHFFIFPSLLIYMGYNPSEVIRSYGPPLWEGNFIEKKFMTGDMFGRSNQFYLYDFDFRLEKLPYDFKEVFNMSLQNRIR